MLKYSTYRSIYDEAPAAAAQTKATIADYTSGLSSLSRKLFTKESFVSAMIVLLLIVSGFTVVGSVFANSVSLPAPDKRIVVASGDTLWGIAREHKPDSIRTAVYIEAIKNLNDLKGEDIQAGDILTLPSLD